MQFFHFETSQVWHLEVFSVTSNFLKGDKNAQCFSLPCCYSSKCSTLNDTLDFITDNSPHF